MDFGVAAFAADNGQVEGGVGFHTAGVGGDDAFADGLNADDCFEGAGGAEGVAGAAFCGADEWGVLEVGEDGADGAGFHGVIVAGACAVGIDVVNVVGGESGALDGVAHGACGLAAFGVGCGDVMGVAGDAETAEVSEGGDAAFFCVWDAFENEDAGAFADGDAGAIFVEGAAAVWGDDFEGVEAAEDNAAEGFAAAGDGDVAFAEGDGVACGTDSHGTADAGGEADLIEADGGDVVAAAEEGGDFVGLDAAHEVGVGGVGILTVLLVVAFVTIHSADGGGHEEGDGGGGVFFGFEVGLGQGFVDGEAG